MTDQPQPEKKVRWGIISTAQIARLALVPGIKRSANGELAAICSRDLSKAEATADELEIPKAYGSYEELLADPEIDAVYNPLPNSMHAEWTIKAAEAGKHVLCEKPLASNAQEAQTMVDACKDAGVVLMEAFMYRFHPQHDRIRKAIEDGVIGKMRYITAAFSFVLDEIGNIRLDSSLAGGSLMDVGCYAVNSCRMITGAEPLEVTAQAWFDPELDCERNIVATLRFPDDVLANIHSSFNVPFQQRYVVFGEKGYALTNHAYIPEPDIAASVELHIDNCHERILVEGCHQYQLEVEAFGRAVLEGEALRWPAEDAVNNMRVLDAIYRSAREGRRVKLDEL